MPFLRFAITAPTTSSVSASTVNHFIRWAENLQDTAMKHIFYPMVDKSLLFEQQYIMARSGHSRGSTVDLTLVDEQTGKELDMGSPFDWFGIESHPDYMDMTEEQIANRHILWDAMFGHGFKGIDSEWWHFTLIDEPYPDTYFEFPVKKNSFHDGTSGDDKSQKIVVSQ